MRCAALVLMVAACSDAPTQFDSAAEEPDSAEPSLDITGVPDVRWCKGLECRIVTCDQVYGSTISGRIFAPDGTLPIYGALVYIPNAPIDPLPEGATCPCCGFPLPPVVTLTGTDASGKFTLRSTPSGTNIPVVVQVGKWRRVVNIPFVADCVDTAIDIRLPSRRSEGNMPKIAVTTGGCDPLACVLPKVGIDPSELGVDASGPERATLYQGSGGDGPTGMKPATALWSSVKELVQFDDVLLSSECSAHDETKTTPSALESYAKFGGRVIATGSHATWMSLIASWKTTAAWSAAVQATAPFPFDTTHPKGLAFKSWIGTPSLAIEHPEANVGALTQMPGKYRFVYSAGGATMLLGFDTPVGAKPWEAWGKVIYADMQAAGGTVDSTYPSGCTGSLSETEKAIAFFLFETQACL